MNRNKHKKLNDDFLRKINRFDVYQMSLFKRCNWQRMNIKVRRSCNPENEYPD